MSNEEPIQLSEKCSSCGKLIAKPSKGSLSAWLFRHSHCECAIVAAVVDLPQVELSTALPSPDKLLPVVQELSESFAIIEHIGSGGMGSVYKAKDKKSDKTLAIKVIRPDLAADPQAVARFVQEARTAASFAHANIVGVYEHGITASGAPYIVMDYLEGNSLEALLVERKRLETQEATALFLQICDALSYLHSQKLVHRDIKPSNILLLSYQGRGSVVKLVDFGIAKTNAGGARAQLTQTGELLGSPPYMSPEQCLGQQLDGRSDIYSLGCVMYHTLSGGPPFPGDNPVHVILQHVQQPARDFASRGITVPDEVTEIVLRCLEKDPAKRYQSVEELRSDLIKIREGQPLHKNFLVSWQKRHARTRKMVLGAVTATVLLALGSLGVTTMLSGTKTTQPFPSTIPVAQVPISSTAVFTPATPVQRDFTGPPSTVLDIPNQAGLRELGRATDQMEAGHSMMQDAFQLVAAGDLVTARNDMRQALSDLRESRTTLRSGLAKLDDKLQRNEFAVNNVTGGEWLIKKAEEYLGKLIETIDKDTPEKTMETLTEALDEVRYGRLQIQDQLHPNSWGKDTKLKSRTEGKKAVQQSAVILDSGLARLQAARKKGWSNNEADAREDLLVALATFREARRIGQQGVDTLSDAQNTTPGEIGTELLGGYWIVKLAEKTTIKALAAGNKNANATFTDMTNQSITYIKEAREKIDSQLKRDFG